MPPLKPVSSLETLSCTTLAASLVKCCARLEKSEEEDGGKEVEGLLDQLPVALLERATHQALELLTSQAGTRGTGPGWAFSRARGGTAASFPGLPTALRLLPRPQTSRLDLGTLFSGARLSRDLSLQCKAALNISLARTVGLTKLELRSKATDSLLNTVGSHCPLLTELNISLSELVSDLGLSSLLSCPRLASIDLLKCWAISAMGVTDLLLGLSNLRRLYFANMKSVLEVLKSKDISKPFLLEHFDSTEYSLLVPGTDIPDPTEAPLFQNSESWLSGPITLKDISTTFPWVSTLRLLLSDQEVEHLSCIQHLVHLEIEFSDDPGNGLLTLLSTHPNRAKFVHIFLQVGPIQSSHLLALATHCTSLQFFRLIGFQVESASSLRPSISTFRNLKHLNISLYDDEDNDSSDDDDDEIQSRHSSHILDFFLTVATNLEVVNIHMNSEAFLTFSYLSDIIEKNPLVMVSHLHISSPKTVKLGEDAVRLVVDRLPSLHSLKISSWDIDYHWFMKELRKEAALTNMDITYL